MAVSRGKQTERDNQNLTNSAIFKEKVNKSTSRFYRKLYQRLFNQDLKNKFKKIETSAHSLP